MSTFSIKNDLQRFNILIPEIGQPFPNSSGKMVKKSKTSPFPDKKLKTILHMGAKAAVEHDASFKLYFQRKQLEGKPYYLIMNNVSNKLLRTVYSVVKNKSYYLRNYNCPDPREKKINSSNEKVAWKFGF